VNERDELIETTRVVIETIFLQQFYNIVLCDPFLLRDVGLSPGSTRAGVVAAIEGGGGRRRGKEALIVSFRRSLFRCKIVVCASSTTVRRRLTSIV